MSEAPARTAGQFAAALRLHQAGRLVEAERLYREICAADVNDAAALHRLGVVAHQLGRGDAAELIARAVALKPELAEAHHDLGVIHGSRGEFAEAAECFTRAVALRPDYAEAHNNLGSALSSLGKFAEATARFERALALKPNFAMAHLLLGNARKAQGKLDEASAHYRRALAIQPNFAMAHYNLGIARKEQGAIDDAVEHYRRTLALVPNFADAHNNLANALKELGRLDDAVAHYDRALALRPDFAPAHYNRGLTLRAQYKLTQASACFAQAVALRPDAIDARFALCMAQLPILYADEAEIAQRRADYRVCLADLRDAVARAPAPGELAQVVGTHQPFYLAYQGCNDRELQALYGSIIARVMAERYPAAALPPPPAPDEPVRVGFVSGFFHAHSNWKIPIKGWLGQLDRRRFRLFGYHTGSDQDGETEAAAALCEHFVQGPLPLDGWRQAILNDAPHVLLYPEVGMDRVCAQLAAQRLAAVQCVAWGHPDTSGFPTLDYFLSSELMEPADGQDHYTEQLVRLPNLSVYCEPSDPPPAAIDRSELGLRKSATVFWCSQSLPKYLPQFDQVFARIAREVDDCQFTFIQFPGAPHITERFRKRLERSFAAFGLRADNHCVVLPRLAPSRYVAAMGQCDIFLDSIGWSGCNSTLDSLVHDLPIVTMTGGLMRGRHTGAILQMMGIGETISTTLDEYVSSAVRVARDLPLRASLKARIAEHKHRVLRDRSCIAGLQDFLDRAARGGPAVHHVPGAHPDPSQAS